MLNVTVQTDLGKRKPVFVSIVQIFPDSRYRSYMQIDDASAVVGRTSK